jgi:hypothetical protein
VRVAAVAIALCVVAPCPVVAPVLPPAPATIELPARGGHAHAASDPSRGGRAIVVLEPIGDLAAWTCIHNGTPVSGGAPGTAGTGEGPWNAVGYYRGGLQMDSGFSHHYGADMYARYGGGPDVWPAREQIVVAERARSGSLDGHARGYYPWPTTARACGLI